MSRIVGNEPIIEVDGAHGSCAIDAGDAEDIEIAVNLSLAKSTAGKHLESIYRKFGVQSRTEAIAQALEKLGFLHHDSM